MAEQALQPRQTPLPGEAAGAGRDARTVAVPRRRVLFGLLDADGWSWAFLKALFWLVAIIMLLGYIPDRAYYFTVFSTIDLGLNVVSPVNICPQGNGSLPCPAPNGAILPWQPASSPQLKLPAARTYGAAVQSGTTILYIGGSDGSRPQPTVYQTSVTSDGNLTGWKTAAALPAPRSHEAVAYLSGTIYVVGGLDANGAPTDTVYSGTPDAKTGAVSSWKPSGTLKLPAARADLTLVAAPDGLFAIGGSDAKGPTSTVWKATADAQGNLGAWAPDGKIGDGAHTYRRSGALGVLQGKYLYLYGGSDASGPTASVLRGVVATPKSGPAELTVWETPTNASANLPAPRAGAAGFTSNGALYLVGGSADGTTPAKELYWTLPDANGNIAGWNELSQTDLPAPGLVGAAVVPASSHAYLLGGTTGGGATSSAERSELSPAPPIFQLGFFGATIPALGIQKEIGQQLGYLAAAGVGTVDFILLVLIGVAMAHKERTRELFERLRERRARRRRARSTVS